MKTLNLENKIYHMPFYKTRRNGKILFHGNSVHLIYNLLNDINNPDIKSDSIYHYLKKKHIKSSTYLPILMLLSILSNSENRDITSISYQYLRDLLSGNIIQGPEIKSLKESQDLIRALFIQGSKIKLYQDFFYKIWDLIRNTEGPKIVDLRNFRDKYSNLIKIQTLACELKKSDENNYRIKFN